MSADERAPIDIAALLSDMERALDPNQLPSGWGRSLVDRAKQAIEELQAKVARQDAGKVPHALAKARGES